MARGILPTKGHIEIVRRQTRFSKSPFSKFPKSRPLVAFLVLYVFLLTRCQWNPLVRDAFDNALKISGLRYSPIALSVNFSDVQFDYHLLSEPKIHRCAEKTLFVFVPSRPSAFEQREAIRETWAHPNKTADVAVFFVVGDPQNESLSEAIESENYANSDLIVNNIVDSYGNLSLKIYTSLSWYNTFCPEVPFVLKIDDDSVVDFDRLLHFTKTEFNAGHDNKTLFCITWKGTRVNRNVNSTWYVPKSSYRGMVYPKYCNGPAYMMTSLAAQGIVEKAAETPLIQVEDAFFTGILAAKAGVNHVDKSGIFWWQDVARVADCDDQGVPRLATMYPFPTPKELFSAYSKLLRVKCRTKTS